MRIVKDYRAAVHQYVAQQAIDLRAKEFFVRIMGDHPDMGVKEGVRFVKAYYPAASIDCIAACRRIAKLAAV